MTTHGRQEDAQSWKLLRLKIESRCRAQVWDPHDREDIVAEIIASAWARFPANHASPEACRWAGALVLPHLAQRVRDRCRRKSSTGFDLDSFPHVKSSSEFSTRAAHELFEALNSTVGHGDRETLAILRTGSVTNVVIASLRGITVTAVEKSRRRLRKAARKLGNLA